MNKIKRMIAWLLAVLTMFALSIPALAAASDPTVETSGSTHVSISQGTRLTILRDQNGVALGGMGWRYTANKESVKGPAYCIAHGLSPVAEGTQLPLTGRYSANVKVTGAFASGYPQVPLAEFHAAHSLPALTEEEYAYSTQLAIWAALGQLAVEGTAFTQGSQEVQRPASGDAQQLRTFSALQAILAGADSWTKNLYRGMSVRWQINNLGHVIEVAHDEGLSGVVDDDTNKVQFEHIGGKDYYTHLYYTSSATTTAPNGNVIDIVPYGPSGTILVAADNSPLSTRVLDTGSTAFMVPTTRRETGLNANGEEYYGSYKLCIPADNVAPEGEVTMIATAMVSQYELYTAYNANNTQQSYIIADPSTGRLYAEGLFKWTSKEAEDDEKRLEITKTGGTGAPLAGAVFRLEGSDGSVDTKTTDSDGRAVFEGLSATAQLTLTETTPPEGYAPVAPMAVMLDGSTTTTYLTVRNNNEPVFRVKKTDRQNGQVLRGGVFRFEQIDGSFTTTATTGFDGYIELGSVDLPFGSYRVSEQTAPSGYLESSEARTVHWTGEADVELVFENVRIPGITLAKVGPYGEPIGDAVFDVYKDGQKIDTVTTNDAGIVRILCGLGEGYYEVEEKSVPASYLLDSTRHCIHFDPYDPAVENDPVIKVVNQTTLSLWIIKRDSASNSPMDNITFDVYKDAVFFGTFQTDNHGEILLSGLLPGTYLVQEVASDPHHVVNSTPQQIELVAGRLDTAQLVFLNELKPGIYLKKLDSQDFRPLRSAHYRISLIGGSFSVEYTTDDSGEINLTALEPGAYLVEEIRAPETHIADDAQRIIQLNPGENALFVFTNTRKPSIEILKWDGKNYLSGATFRIAKIEDGSHYLDRITDTEGRILIDGLEPGVYSVQEISPPPGYVRSDAEYHVELFPGKVSQLVVVNEKKPNLLIRKTDAKSSVPVPGVSYTVRKMDSSTLTTVTTDAKGECFLEGLDPGVYEIEEVGVPDNYLLAREPKQLITLVPGETGIVKYANYKKSTLTVNKVDSVTSSPVQGAKVRIWYASNNTFTGELNDLGSFYTDEKGQVVLTGLRDGWYRITEEEPASGYALKEPITQEKYVGAGESESVTIVNIPLSALIIRKLSYENGSAVPNTYFRVRYLGGTSGSGGTIIFDGATNTAGAIILTGLTAGTYVCEEYKAAPGFELSNPSVQTAYISGKDQDVVELVFHNLPMGQVVLEKRNSVNNAPLAGAKIKVTYASGAVVGPNNGIYITDVNGLINLGEYLSVGDAIVAQEIEAPRGFALDRAAQTLEIKSGALHKLTFFNTPIGGLQISKKDAENGRPVPSTKLRVSKMSGEVIGTYTTDNNGLIFIPELDDGWYSVEEVASAKGYLLDGTVHNIEVKDGETALLTITNRKASGILLHKVDSESGAGIPNVKFLLYDDGNNPVGQYETDQDGRVYIGGELPDGRYRLRELEPAPGYIADDQVRTVYLEYGRTTEITWENTHAAGQIMVTKRSALFNPTTNLPAGTPLAGAVFEIYTLSGNLAGRMVSDARGIAASQPLPLGVYVLKEVSSPQYYALSPREFIAELRHHGDIVRFEVLNDNVELGVTIQKKSQNNASNGQMIYYDLFGIANQSSAALERFYVHDRLPTDAVRGAKVFTGTWSHNLTYRVTYQTNYSSAYRVLASGLSTQVNYELSIHPNVLGLMSGEYVTGIRWEFGTVPAGFASVVNPKLQCQVLSTLPKGYKIVNRAEVGGLYIGQWLTAQASWLTLVYDNPVKLPELPKSGY